MAWLHATPPKKKETRAQDFRRRYGDDCPELELPDVGSAEHIAADFCEVGPTVKGEEITQMDLHYFQENTGAVLTEFAAKTMIRMSREYLSRYREYGSKVCPPPWRRPLTPEERIERNKQQIAARKARQQGKT